MDQGLIQFGDSQQTMSSLEIAKVTGKRHKDILHDIRKISKTNGLDYDILSYKDKTGRNLPCYMITVEFVGLLNMRYGSKELVELCGQVYVSNKNRCETLFGDILISILNKFGIDIESQYKVGRFRIDFYIKKYKIAIEFDEDQHNRFKNVMSDNQRQEFCEKVLGCSFIRLNEKDSLSVNLSKVLCKVLRKK